MKTFTNVVTRGLSGKIEGLVFRQRNGDSVVSKRPCKRSGCTLMRLSEKAASFLFGHISE